MSATSTTVAEANKALVDRFHAVWTAIIDPATSGPYPYVLENEAFDPPDGGTYARFAIRHQTSRQDTLGAVGGRKFDRRGAAFAQIFTPQNGGMTLARTLSQTVLEGFEGARLTGTTLRFLDVIPREVGPTGPWWNNTVEIGFAYTETR